MVILDLNNFWSPSGGGVRRYHLEKMAHYKNRTDARLVFVMPDKRRYTEYPGPGLVVEHIPAPKIPGHWDYRFIWNPRLIRTLMRKHEPDIVEVGSPYWLPVAVRWATWGLRKKPALVGFWHADFPVTYVRRFFERFGGHIAAFMESLAWLYARWAYRGYRGIMVSSCAVMARMIRRGLDRLHWVPLGVDTELFHPDRRDERLIAELKAGCPDRLTIFFPHRLTEEKGAVTLIHAYPLLCEKLGVEPAIVFAGRGNYQPLVEAAARQYSHIRYVGFIESPREVARWMASCELGLALSAWETFGLAILEAMASGQCLVGANDGAAREHIESAQCGLIVKPGDPSALAEALAYAVRGKKMAEWRANARRYAETMTWDQCFARQEEFYRKIVFR